MIIITMIIDGWVLMRRTSEWAFYGRPLYRQFAIARLSYKLGHSNLL